MLTREGDLCPMLQAALGSTRHMPLQRLVVDKSRPKMVVATSEALEQRETIISFELYQHTSSPRLCIYKLLAGKTELS